MRTSAPQVQAERRPSSVEVRISENVIEVRAGAEGMASEGKDEATAAWQLLRAGVRGKQADSLANVIRKCRDPVFLACHATPLEVIKSASKTTKIIESHLCNIGGVEYLIHRKFDSAQGLDTTVIRIAFRAKPDTTPTPPRPGHSQGPLTVDIDHLQQTAVICIGCRNRIELRAIDGVTGIETAVADYIRNLADSVICVATPRILRCVSSLVERQKTAQRNRDHLLSAERETLLIEQCSMLFDAYRDNAMTASPRPRRFRRLSEISRRFLSFAIRRFLTSVLAGFAMAISDARFGIGLPYQPRMSIWTFRKGATVLGGRLVRTRTFCIRSCYEMSIAHISRCEQERRFSLRRARARWLRRSALLQMGDALWKGSLREESGGLPHDLLWTSCSSGAIESWDNMLNRESLRNGVSDPRVRTFDGWCYALAYRKSPSIEVRTYTTH